MFAICITYTRTVRARVKKMIRVCCTRYNDKLLRYMQLANYPTRLRIINRLVNGFLSVSCMHRSNLWEYEYRVFASVQI